MHLRYLTLALACALGSGLCCAQSETVASALSELDYMADVPIVLSVSRLAQRLDETPGAMTILDRDFIRMTGARDVADVLRFVPGFQVTKSFETDAPLATYHGRIDDYANRIQVLVDGRSVYSTYLQGSAGVGWQTLALEDIERIEILRGSNSASYGARAFLGVVNIVSRDTRLSSGAAVWANVGENAVSDQGVRLGWGNNGAAHRLTVDSRAEDGLRRVFGPDVQDYGKNQITRFNYAGEIDLGRMGGVALHVGSVDMNAIRGTPGDVGNVARDRSMGSQYAQVDWKYSLSADEDISVQASRTWGYNQDEFPYLDHLLVGGVDYYGATVAFSGQEIDDEMGVRYTRRFSNDLQAMAGGEVRREYLFSPSSFDTRESVTSHFVRAYSSVEWRAMPALTVNGGGLLENSDIGGTVFSPRLMLNWHANKSNTFRAGYSSAFRTPSPYEMYADVKYYDVTHKASVPFARASGDVAPEKVYVRELGYNLNLPLLGVNADARAFIEDIQQGIGHVQAAYDGSATGKGDSRNGDNFQIQGLEFQVDWKLASATRLFLAQNWTQTEVKSLAFPNASDPSDWNYVNNIVFKIAHGAPKSTGSVVLDHRFARGYSATVMYQSVDEFALASDNGRLFSMVRTDVRFAREIRGGWGKAEAALTLQNLNLPYQDGDKKFFFDKRLIVSMRVEY